MPTKEEHAAYADKALEAHAVAVGNVDEGRHTQLVDLLADLMHLADSETIDFDAALETARGHHAAETKED